MSPVDGGMLPRGTWEVLEECGRLLADQLRAGPVADLLDMERLERRAIAMLPVTWQLGERHQAIARDYIIGMALRCVLAGAKR